MERYLQENDADKSSFVLRRMLRGNTRCPNSQNLSPFSRNYVGISKSCKIYWPFSFPSYFFLFIKVLFTKVLSLILKVLFSRQIFEMEVLIDLHFLRSPSSENHIFNGEAVCKSVISITLKYIIPEISNWNSTFTSYVATTWN